MWYSDHMTSHLQQEDFPNEKEKETKETGACGADIFTRDFPGLSVWRIDAGQQSFPF